VKYSYYVVLACVRFRRYFLRPKIFTGQNSSADNGLRYKFIGKVKPHGIEKRKKTQKCDINDLEYERIILKCNITTFGVRAGLDPYGLEIR
jgi:hypothetical protein